MASRSIKWVVWIVLLGILTLGVFYADSIFDKAVNKTLSLAINAINAKKELIVCVDSVNVSLKKGSIVLKGISVVPDSVYYEQFNSGKIVKKMLTAVQISEVELTGLSIKSIFWDGRIDSAKISVKDVITNIYLRAQTEGSSKPPQKSSRGILDSLHLKGLHNIDLGVIEVSNYQINILSTHTKDTLWSFLGDDMELDGVNFEKRIDGSNVFDLKTEKLRISFKKQRLKLPHNDYEINLGVLEYSNVEQMLKIEDFNYRPIKSLEHLASKKKYADNLFDVNFKHLTITGLNIDSYRENHFARAKKVNIEGMHLNLFKNKQKPEDLKKRPLLPHQILKKSNFPIHIDQIAIESSSLTYKEIQPKNVEDILIVNLTELNARLNFITSIKDSLLSGIPLTVALNSRMLNNTKINVNMSMPYNHPDNAFHFIGSLGATDLKLFNPILLPTAHIIIDKGHLKDMHFFVNATPKYAKGELTMRYSDLHVDIPLKHKNSEHAFSFLANSVIHKFNPKKNGKLRVIDISYDRIPHKGLGGYMIKSILSGVTNTIVPFENRREQKKKDKEEKKEARKENKRKKQSNVKPNKSENSHKIN